MFSSGVFFTLIRPVWVGDLVTRLKNQGLKIVMLYFEALSPKCRGRGEVAGSQPMSTVVKEAQINFGILPPDLTYVLRRMWRDVTAGLKFGDIEAATEAKCALEHQQREQVPTYPHLSCG
jgi:hypothetical protein